MKKYPEAVTSYEAVNKTNMASASSFYSEAKAKELAKADIKEIIALMDSAVSKFNEPYGKGCGSLLVRTCPLPARSRYASGKP